MYKKYNIKISWGNNKEDFSYLNFYSKKNFTDIELTERIIYLINKLEGKVFVVDKDELFKQGKLNYDEFNTFKEKLIKKDDFDSNYLILDTSYLNKEFITEYSDVYDKIYTFIDTEINI